MTPTLSPSTTATRPDAPPPQPPPPEFTELVQELVDLTAGLGIALLPVLPLAVPGIILFVVLPGILVLAVATPVAVIGGMIALPPYLLARWLRRRRPPSAAGHER